MVSQVIVGMGAGDAYCLGNQCMQVSGVALDAEWQSWQDATTHTGADDARPTGL
jgi:hypothetical protein